MKTLIPTDPLRSQELIVAQSMTQSNSIRRVEEHQLPQQDLTLSQLLQILRRRRSLIVKAVGITVVLGVLLCILSPSKYVSTGTILVQNGSGEVLDRNALMGSGPTASDPIEADITVQTQAKILQSNTLALRAIRKLDLGNSAWLTSTSGIVSALSDFIGHKARQSSRVENPEKTRAKLLKNFEDSLTVKAVPGTRLLDVGFSSTNPQLAAQVVNELVRDLTEYTYETRYKATQAASDSLTIQLADLRSQSESLQATVAAMQQESGLYSIGTTDTQGRQQTYSATLDQFQRAATTLSDASQNRVLKQAIYDAAKDGNAELISSLAGNTIGGSAGAGITGSLSTIQQLRTQQATLQGQLDQLKVKFGTGYPRLAELEGNLDSLSRAIQQETTRISGRARSDYLVADQNWKGAQEAYQRQKVQADSLNNRTIKYMIARQEADESRTLYEDLLKRLKEVGILQGLKSDTISVIDEAVAPLNPATPNIPLYLAAALAIGLLGGCVGALFVELIDDTVRDAAAIEQMGLPLLGILPAARPQRRGLEVDNSQISAYTDAVRNIRLALIRPGVGKLAQIVLVTSDMPNKSKAMLSASLATSGSKAGKKVLLVEADRRDSSLQKIIGLGDSVGLSQIVLGKEVNDNIAHYPHLSALYVLPANSQSIETAPSALVDLDQMPHLLAEWRDKFDLVIIDAASVLSFTDTRFLAEMADVTIEVAEHGTTTLASLKRAHRVLSHHTNGDLYVVLGEVNQGSMAYQSSYGYPESASIVKGVRS
jgi:succinoglycan biosynthesis transport protein ExoP